MSEPLGLGIDAGGTHTRWALAQADGTIVASGEARGISAHLMSTTEGRQRIRDVMAEVAKGALAVGRIGRVQAGVTGLPDTDPALRAMLAEPFGLEADAVTVQSDIVFAYLGQFRPGEGYVVYAGTGSVAAFIDDDGALHRAGGRGTLLDDGGGGFWIAREALRHVWRNEDANPGAWKRSPLARELFARLGGPDWPLTRQAVYGGDRGEVGRLALAVAETAGRDPVAMAILEQAGAELARLGNAMLSRFGARPVVLTGRAATLHPVIQQAMQAGLPANSPCELRQGEAHFAAARRAASAA
ncbi:MAG TPA: BadF/BadG/BcrA/BcrD ATPase family protein [Usitatibacter sp.]|nr:BadF/BadG/BcrA/BcrD ATPase family protein [Usitatibacter sp.]